MGCLNDKEEEANQIPDDREERDRNERESGSARVGISIPAPGSSPVDGRTMRLGRSVQDERDAEEEYFKDLVEKTSKNFINVSEDSFRYSDDEEMYRSLKVRLELFSEVEQSPLLPLSSSLPVFESNVSEETRKMMDKYQHTFATAMTDAMNVHFDEDIVVKFEPS
mmetsp:Transcript_32123/g.50281  ORF Transcript_32123/g.50281 Transcript_32123/m.50281 type:complete len:166 (-) Transcript_32123:651-1148(-)